MIRWFTGWFRSAPPAPPLRTADQLADMIEATPTGGVIVLYSGESLRVAEWIVQVRREKADSERRRRMRGGYDIPGVP